MRLRELRLQDAPLMLEWMHDDFVVHDLATDFSKKNIDDCIEFIEYATEQAKDMIKCRDIHLAIADDNDEYMGTVSLKNINRKFGNAEFAITVRRLAMGRGFGKYAMNEIIRLGFETLEFNINNIYWCVDKKNIRARRFYDKQNFEIVEANEEMKQNYNVIGMSTELIWYSIQKFATVNTWTCMRR